MANLSSTAAQAKRHAQRVKGDWVEPVARAGYATKGVVYGIVGVLALQTAFGSGGEAEGSKGALGAIATQPFGQILLGLTAIGLLAYALWRFVQAIVDTEDEGTDAKGLFKRIAFVVSGLSYAFLAYWAGSAVLGSGSGGGTSKEAFTAKVLAQPFGQWLVGLVGLILLGVGVYHFIRAYKASFMKHYKQGEMSGKEKRWAKRIGQFGLSARGVTFCLIGGFVIQAALQRDPSEAGGLSEALSTLARQPYGPWLLGVVALGFVAYGIYCVSRARYRYFETS